MGGADLHSRIVGWLKVALPLAALAILSTLFLLSDRIDPNAAIPYADVDVEDLVRDPRMSSPAYAGITSDGAGITLSASEVHPASTEGNAVASSVVAIIETPDGQTTRIAADRAELDSPARLLRLTGGVDLETASGYRIQADSLRSSLDRTRVESTSPINVTGPLGTLVADSFSLEQDNSDPAAYLLVFKGGVKLVYQPGG